MPSLRHREGVIALLMLLGLSSATAAPARLSHGAASSADSFVADLTQIWQGHCAEGAERFERMALENPQSLEARVLRDTCNADRGNLRDAARGLAASIDAQVPGSEPRAIAAAYSTLAAIFYKSDRNAQALEMSRRALALWPDVPYARGVAGAVLLIEEEFAQALPLFVDLESQDGPVNVSTFAQFGRSSCLLRLQRYTEALPAFLETRESALIEQRPTGHLTSLFPFGPSLVAGADIGVATSYHGLGRWREAVEAYQKVLGSQPQLASGDTLVKFGEAQSRMGKWKEGARTFEAATRVDPRSSKAYHWLGTAHSWLRNWPAAIEAFRSAIAIRFQDGESHYLLGIALIRNGDREAALEQQRILESISPLAAKRLKEILIDGSGPDGSN